jgi:acetolactate synthase-1/2/3 large subunit
MVRNLEDVAYGKRHSATERKSEVNFAELAKHCQYDFAERITSRPELADGIAAFMKAAGPCFLEVMTDIEEVLYPVVRAGSSYKDMELGPYIKEVK